MRYMLGRRGSAEWQFRRMEICQCIVEATNKLWQTVDITERRRIEPQDIEDAPLIPEGGIQQDDSGSIGSSDRENTPERPGAHFPEIDEQSRSKQHDINFNAGSQ